MLSASSTELEATAESMTGTASQSNQQAAAVASAAEEASTGLQTVASAAEQLMASIGEFSRQVAQSSKITGKAVDDARRSDAIVRALAEGAEKVRCRRGPDHQHRQPDQSSSRKIPRVFVIHSRSFAILHKPTNHWTSSEFYVFPP
jgi:ABC-type transporter Mla subunit MlaD